ncbi:uncharacterized protein UTRI_05921 [Ustilago trichophora]|uniref:Haem-binding uptake Tiki superfamily ChaN domain-containing protein n=1 Tax=Ustilago trichophora TaxID=86804 RepID=A0A5C3EI33_9BASI|nr:uncharacterized protein UTRI_05921 [Ustilago trichophora]
MSSIQPDQHSEQHNQQPLRAMSIARFIPRFSKPRLLTSDIPTYRHSFSLPVDESKVASTQADQPHNTDQQPPSEPSEDASQPASASYVEWSKLLPLPSNLLGSFQDIFGPQRNVATSSTQNRLDEQQDSIGTHPTKHSASPPPRLIFFGEQHHQPQVMRAQLQTLHALHQQCQLASTSHSHSQARPSSTQSPIYRLHLILEHFSVLDQNMLNSFSNGNLGPDELAETYQSQSEESFHIGHYMPLLMLAKELQVPIWGGFPPRSWARHVFREGVESVKIDEEKRVSRDSPLASASQQKEFTSQQSKAVTTPYRSPLFTSWNAVTKISAAHRSYLSGLMRPDLPPRFPQLPDTLASQLSGSTSEDPDDDTIRHPPIYPTWLLKPHNIETKGFGPAQALKDSYLAHVTAWILRGARPDASNIQDTSPASSTPAATSQHLAASPAIEAGENDRPIVNVALVVCGLGHCEYGFGAPERVVQLLSHQDDSSDGSATLLPYIIASKPLDSGVWLGYEHSLQPTSTQSNCTDMPTSTQPEDKPLEPTLTCADAVQRWLTDPWGRKMADAVLLYDWIDDEPNDETHANADRHQPTPN